ncbi:MAG: amidohydrolase [Planctomycetota bacterium]|jgi:predicted amidohydrolase YtcJ
MQSCLFLFITLIGAAEAKPPADLVIRNAKVLTIDDEQPYAQAVAIAGETILFVGSNEDVRSYIDPAKTQTIDARGRLVTPGFNDAHVHFVQGGRSVLEVNLNHANTLAQVQQAVKARAAELAPGTLIRGRGWDHERFPDKSWPTKETLDAVAPNHPVALSRTDGHSIWVSSLLLRQAGITRDTADPPGGTIVRDPSTGEPTGILKESAQGLLKLGDYGRSNSEQREFDEQSLEKALAEARHTGVTSIQQLNAAHELFARFREEGRLTVRVTFNMTLTADPNELASYERLRRRFPPENNWIRFGYLKDFIDGTLGSGTALMFEPFKDDPTTSGLPQMSYAELERRVLAADRLGFQIGIHAIGTKGNHWVLNAYEKARQINGQRDSRHRVEHAQILADVDIPRFAQLDVIASMQPTHCISDKRFAEKRIGRDRCRGAYAWRRLLDAGARIAFGTDWPVEPLDPLEGLYAAVTRKDRAGEPGDGWFPDQRLSIKEAIKLYTLDAAYAEFTEDRKGKIQPGYLADLVIFDRDLLTVDPETIMQARVDTTIVGGRVVYQRP